MSHDTMHAHDFVTYVWTSTQYQHTPIASGVIVANQLKITHRGLLL